MINNTYNNFFQIGDTVRYVFDDTTNSTRVYGSRVFFMAYSEYNPDNNEYNKVRIVYKKINHHSYLGNNVTLLSSKTVLIEKFDLLMVQGIESAIKVIKRELNDK